MSKFEDVDLVNYIINNGATLKDAAEFFDVSVDTIKVRMRKIKSGLQEDSIILKDLNNVSNANTLEGRKRGGKSPNSGVVRSIDLETIANQAKFILSQDLSIDEAAKVLRVAPSTLYEHLELLKTDDYLDIYQDLKKMYKDHLQDRNGFHVNEKYDPILEEKRK